jgi:hypothetical protein
VAAELDLIQSGFATTTGLNQIVTPDLQAEGNLSLAFRRKASALRILMN